VEGIAFRYAPCKSSLSPLEATVMKKGFTLIEAVVTCVIFLAIAWVTLKLAGGPDNAPRSSARRNAKALAAALSAYHTEYGTFPSGDHASVVRALCGENSKNILFLEIPDQFRAKGGEFEDPWRTPYRIAATNASDIVITSAGPNRRFDDNDDITNQEKQ
jgi:type II secretory pathway pseudopilin PulG